MKSKLNRRYNVIKPVQKDPRNFKYSLKMASAAVVNPPKASVQAGCPPVVNQLDIGSCTANAGAGMNDFNQLAELKAKESPATGKQIFEAGQFFPSSRLQLYYDERVLEGDPMEDGGAQVSDVVKVLCDNGVCKEVTWPYNEQLTFTAPSSQAVKEAALHKSSVYMELENINDMKHCIASGFPFIFGFMVYESFESDTVATTGIMPMPGPNEECLGGHCVLAVAYDDSKKAFLVRNSWGTDWALGGYFWMPYAFISNPDYASEFFTVRK